MGIIFRPGRVVLRSTDRCEVEKRAWHSVSNKCP